MKSVLTYFHLFMFLILSSCENESAQYNTELKLDYNIGRVRLNLPENFDGFNKYYNNTKMGCGGGSGVVQRFFDINQDNFPLLDTIPIFLPGFNRDSLMVNSFSISVNPKDKGEGNIKDEVKSFHKKFSESILSELPKVNFLVDDCLNINGLCFSLLAYRYVFFGKYSEKYMARTLYNNTWIKITAQRLSTDSSNFVNEMHEVMKTVQFVSSDN